MKMDYSPYPTKQTADSEAHRQSLPSWGDLEGYFGARYYDSDLSIWLSVDPLASKYPSLSPYVYCANNPVKLVDPDGREIAGPWPMIKGIVTTVGGVVGTGVGTAMCLVPGGQVFGGFIVATSIPAIGLGVGQIYDAAKNDGQSNIPGGVFEAVGQGADYAAGNEDNTFATAGAVLDIMSGGVPKSSVETVVAAAKIAVLVEENINSGDQTTPTQNDQSNKNSQNNSSNTPSTSNKSNTSESKPLKREYLEEF